MLTESSQKAVGVQCKNFIYFKKMKGALRLKVVGTEEAVISLPNSKILFERMKAASLMERCPGLVAE